MEMEILEVEVVGERSCDLDRRMPELSGMLIFELSGPLEGVCELQFT